ncbi:MAG: aldose 1-epimerase [Bacteroidota bacterium]|nr:aldose 1-epimerase [Kiloniellaceae bacterium]
MSDPSNSCRLRLADGIAEVEVAPADGGSLAAFRWRAGDRTIDWLRPAPAAGGFAPNAGACFPLVPYSNRIRDGRFRFDGREHCLRPNFGASPHSIHGHGWQHPWDVTARSETAVTLTFRHDGGDWPQPYRAEQRIALDDGVLSLALSVTNEGRGSMPAGLGLHPYFPRTPDCRLTAPVARMWATDAEVMPTALVTPSPGADPNAGLRPAGAALDNVFTGFGGQAVIDWPERGTALTLEADPAFAFVVVYTPPGADFFCAEPVSHCTDAVNLAAAGQGDTGLRTLAPGETFAATLRLLPRWGARS